MSTPPNQGTHLFIPTRSIEENPAALRPCNKTEPAYLELVDSIKENGFTSTITVVPALDASGKPRFDAEGKPVYTICDGLQRWNGAKDAGVDTISCLVLNKTGAEFYALQIVMNSVKIETQHAQYAKGLARILSTDPTMTVAVLAKKLSKSPTWIAERLNLARLDDKIGKFVDDGSIPLSNAIELAKLPPEEQQNFLSAAMNESTSLFGPKVKARVKEIREANRAGRDPNAPRDFIPVPHQRKFTELKDALAQPSEVVEYVQRTGATTAEDIVKTVLKWAVHMDEASIAKAKADAEARKKAEEADKAKRAADRAAQKAAETQAKLATVGAA